MTHQTQQPTAATTPAWYQDGRILRIALFAGGTVGGGVLGLILLLFGWLIFGRGGDDRGRVDAVAGTAEVSPGEQLEPPPPAPAPGQTAATGVAETPVTEPARGALPGEELVPREPSAEELAGVQEKLRTIALGFHYFHDVYRAFAPPRAESAAATAVGQPVGAGPPPTGLSWRVHLLPFIQQQPLYERFHLDEPWDSPHNKSLLPYMPEIYRIGSGNEPLTRFQVITGPGMLFGNAQQPRIRDCADGTRHTILVVTTGPDRAVIWTRPDDLTLDPSAPLDSLGPLPDGLIPCVMVDGKPLLVPGDIPPADFLALATPRAGEIIDADRLRRQFAERNAETAHGGTAVPAGTAAGSGPGPAAPAVMPAPENPAEQPAATPSQPTPVSLTPAMCEERKRKLKEISLAMQNYHDVYRQFPVAGSDKHFDQAGQPHLSWRVHLLPFLDQQPLYQQFHLDEPWDSPHNLQLLDDLPDVYRDPTDQLGGTETRFVTFTGPDTPFSGGRGPRSREFLDHPATILLVVTCGSDRAVPWTKPEDLSFDPEAPVECLGRLDGPGIFFVRVDGAVMVLQPTIPAAWFQAFVTPSGRESLPTGWREYELR
jgi:hypothetical protein